MGACVRFGAVATASPPQHDGTAEFAFGGVVGERDGRIVDEGEQRGVVPESPCVCSDGCSRSSTTRCAQPGSLTVAAVTCSVPTT